LGFGGWGVGLGGMPPNPNPPSPNPQSPIPIIQILNGINLNFIDKVKIL
jgi:hypothetical protein